MKTLIKCGYIIINDEKGVTYIKDGYVGVENEIISYVGEVKPEERFDSEKDFSNCIVMPGLYNTHTHSPMVLLRGVGSDLPLDKWLFGEVCPIEDKLTAEDISAGSYLACMEMLSSGTVSFSDMYFEPQTTAEAVINTGMKANISRPVQCFDPSETPETSYRIRQALELYDTYNGAANGRILTDFCIHAEYTCNDLITGALAGMCNERNGNLHIHLSETDKEQAECIGRHGKTPAQWFESLGAFDSGAFAAHCVVLTDEDAEILKKHGVSIIHNPTSNMKLASGFADIRKYTEMGINVGLGTDGAASNNNLDMFEEMHIAGVIHKGYNKDATAVNAQTVINMATLNGARVQRRENSGSIKVGNRADIIAVSLDKPHMYPCLDPIALLVYSAQGSDVCFTMCDGKVLYENGEYKTLDSEKVMFNVKKAVERLYR